MNEEKPEGLKSSAQMFWEMEVEHGKEYADEARDRHSAFIDRINKSRWEAEWRPEWVLAWAQVGWLSSTDILQQTFQGAMTHTIAALMNFKNAVDALHSRQDNMRVDIAKLQQRLK